MRRKPLAWVAGAALFVLALAGCGKVTTDMAVNDDGTYDMALIMAASETELATAGQTPESFIALMNEQFALQPGIEAFVVADYQADGFAGVEITGSDIPGDDVGMFGRGVFTADSDGVYFDLQYPITMVTSTFTPEQTDLIEITTTVTFPGEVVDHNGTLIDDYTVEWSGNGSSDLDYTASSVLSGGAAEPTDEATDEATEEATEEATDEATDSAADSDEKDDDGAGWILPVGIGLAVLAIIGVVTWLILRNRKSGAQGGPGAPGAYNASQPWGQPGQQGPGAPGAPQQGQQGQQWGQPQAPQQGQPGQSPQQGQPEPPQWGKP